MISNSHNITNKNMVFGIKLMVNVDADSESEFKIAKIGNLSFFIFSFPYSDLCEIGSWRHQVTSHTHTVSSLVSNYVTGFKISYFDTTNNNIVWNDHGCSDSSSTPHPQLLPCLLHYIFTEKSLLSSKIQLLTLSRLPVFI